MTDRTQERQRKEQRRRLVLTVIGAFMAYGRHREGIPPQVYNLTGRDFREQWEEEKEKTFPQDVVTLLINSPNQASLQAVDTLLKQEDQAWRQEILGEALKRCVYMEQIPRIKWLLESGANPNGEGRFNMETLIEHSATEGKDKVVELLLESGAKPKTKSGKKLLEVAKGERTKKLIRSNMLRKEMRAQRAKGSPALERINL